MIPRKDYTMWIRINAFALALAVFILSIGNETLYLTISRNELETPRQWFAIFVLGAIFGTISGVIVGVMQGRFLRHKVAQVRWWAAATILGFLVASGLFSRWLMFTPDNMLVLFSFPSDILVSTRGLHMLNAVAFGLIVGYFQWMVLRRHCSNAWHWLWGSAIGLGAGLSIVTTFSGLTLFLLAKAIGADWGGILHVIVAGMIGGILYGGITGLALNRILESSEV